MYKVNSYVLFSSGSTVGVLTIIKHRVSDTLDIKDILRAIALNILKAFDDSGLIYNLSSYVIYGSVFLVSKSFLSGRSIKVFVNGQFSEAQ